MTSLKKLAIRGTVWTIASYGVSQLLRFGSNLILTRLLFPKLFGLMALVNILIVGLHLFSDIGVGPSIIQNKRGNDPDFLNTAWTLQIFRGFCLWFFCVLIAWPVANFYGEPQLFWLLPVVGISTMITGFNSTSIFTLNREMALGKLAIFESVTQALALVVMIVWAWFSPTIWALVFGGLVSDLVRMVWSHRLISGYSNRFVWKQETANELFSFGRWIFVSTSVTFLGTQVDRLILGKLISLELLGVYGIAFTLAYLPSQVIGALSSKVIFPTVSKLAHLPRETLRTKILQNRKPLIVSSALILTVLVCFGDMLVFALYDKRYAQAAWMLPLLAIGIWPNLLSETLRQCLVAVGRPSYQAYGQLLKCIYMCIGIPLGFSLKGMLGAVIVVALNDIPVYVVIAYGLWREELASLKQDIQVTMLLLVLVALVLAGRAALGFGLPLSNILAFH